MSTLERAWVGAWTIGLAAGFGGLGIFGIGLMIGAIWYPTGLFWGVMVFLLGLFGLLAAIGAGLTALNRPRQPGWSNPS